MIYRPFVPARRRTISDRLESLALHHKSQAAGPSSISIDHLSAPPKAVVAGECRASDADKHNIQQSDNITTLLSQQAVMHSLHRVLAYQTV